MLALLVSVLVGVLILWLVWRLLRLVLAVVLVAVLVALGIGALHRVERDHGRTPVTRFASVGHTFTHDLHRVESGVARR